MASFYPVKVTKNVDGRSIGIGFNREGNKHLFSDTYGRSKFFKKIDLLELPNLLEKSTYVTKADLSKRRKDKISRFYYFKTEVRGNTIYLNVAEKSTKKRNERYIYAVTDKIKTE